MSPFSTLFPGWSILNNRASDCEGNADNTTHRPAHLSAFLFSGGTIRSKMLAIIKLRFWSLLSGRYKFVKKIKLLFGLIL